MDETSWSSDFQSDIFSLGFDSLFNTIDLESLESKESSDTVPEVLNTTNRESERAVLAETAMETDNLPAPDESRLPLTSNEQMQETIKEAENKNTLRMTKTWMRVWYSWAKSRQINESKETMAPAALDGVLQKFYLEVRKQDGSEYEPEALKVMQEALERYLSTQKYPYSLVNSLEFSSSRAVLEAKAKQLRMNGYGKRKNRALPYNSAEEESFRSSGLLGDHDGVALTNVNFKNLSEHIGFRGRQDHYDAYVQDFEVAWIQIQGGELARSVPFNENPTKTRSGDLSAKHRKTPQEMWATGGGPRDPVRLFEEFLRRRPLEMRTSGPLYLGIIQRPKTEVWYAKSRMGEHKLGSIMKALAQTISIDGKKISNHSTRKAIVAKLKKAGQPRHKIIQITGHPNETSLDDYDEIDEEERRTLSHIISGYSGPSTKTSSSKASPPSSNSLPVPPSTDVVVPSSKYATSSSTSLGAAISQASAYFLAHQYSNVQSPITRTNDPAVEQFRNCTVNIQNYFGPQSTNQANSSRVECQIGEITSPIIPRRKRKRAYIIDSDED